MPTVVHQSDMVGDDRQVDVVLIMLLDVVHGFDLVHAAVTAVVAPLSPTTLLFDLTNPTDIVRGASPYRDLCPIEDGIAIVDQTRMLAMSLSHTNPREPRQSKHP